MKRFHVATLALLALCLTQPLAASDFVVLGATGVLEPEGLQAGQELSENTRLRLEPWGRAMIRETGECGLTHVVAGASDHVLTPSQDCSAVAEPMEVAALIQQGQPFAAKLEQTGSPLADQLVATFKDDPCVFLPRVSEGGKRRCPSGYALRALRCSGDHCGYKDLLCCPYLDGAPDPSAKEMSARWISEEFPNSIQTKRFLDGLSCRGLHCDDILPSPFKSEHLAQAKACEWSAWSVEQPGAWLDCQPGRLMSGIRCRDDFCGDVALYCCQAKTK